VNNNLRTIKIRESVNVLGIQSFGENYEKEQPSKQKKKKKMQKRINNFYFLC